MSIIVRRNMPVFCKGLSNIDHRHQNGRGEKKMLRMMVFVIIAAMVATVSAALSAVTTRTKGMTRSKK